jgi:hypothetical protein
MRKQIVAYSITNSVLVWNVQTDETYTLRVSVWQNGYEFGILFCAMKGLINRVGWSFPHAFDAGCTGHRPLVFRQLPASALIRPEAGFTRHNLIN